MPKTPYTNFHELNQDWIIKTIKKMFSPDNPPPYPVESVNGKTGEVMLTGEDIDISENNQTSIKAFCDALLLAIQQKYTLPSTGLPWNDLAQAVKDIINAKYNLPSGGVPWDDLAQGVKDTINAKYVKPTGGIPKADLAFQVVDALNTSIKTNVPDPGQSGQIPVSNGTWAVWTNPGDIPSLAYAIATAVNTWLTANITNPSSPPLDRSLTQSNAAAPADLVGNLKDAFVNETILLTLIPNKYILRDDGTEAAYNGWSATDYIAVPPKQRLICHTTTTLSWGARYNENKVYVEAFGWTNNAYYFNSTDKTIYFRISGADADMVSTSFSLLPVVDTTLTENGYPANAKTVGDRLSALETMIAVIPSYYVSHLSAKEATIRTLFDNCGYNGDGFIFLTDTHFSADLFSSNTPTSYFNANNSFALIKDIINKCAISTIIFGGDLVNSTTDVDSMLYCLASFGAKWENRQPRLRFCIGNHEYFTGNDYGHTIKPTNSELYGAGIKYNENVVLKKGPMDTYFFDNKAQAIRYFIISCGRDTELSKTQVAWVLNEFTKLPEDYNVVCIGHAFMTDNMAAFRGYHANIMDALDAIKAATSYTFENVTYDYSTLTNVIPVCAITGHTHIDGSLTSNGGIPCICTTTDSYANNYTLVNGVPTSTPRTKGTTDEQAFDVIQFDFTNRKIHCTRIGYGSDREFSY